MVEDRDRACLLCAGVRMGSEGGDGKGDEVRVRESG